MMSQNSQSQKRNRKEEKLSQMAPENIFDYIRSTLQVIAKNKEFLRIDFPRVPYRKTKTILLGQIGRGVAASAFIKVRK